MSYLEIEKVIGREIIDSRGNPTVEAEVWLADGTIGRGAAPRTSTPPSTRCWSAWMPLTSMRSTLPC